ncbi:MAG: cell division protein Fic [Verrucomicrobiales bacterium]|nr:cell division protein Fic [Verrucomicrobiales bacterium]
MAALAASGKSLVLSRWNPLFAWLPVESVIRDRQADYYQVLAACDKAGNSSAFVEFMLSAILTALREASGTEQDTEPVTEQVGRLLEVLGETEQSAGCLMQALALAHRPTFLYTYLQPALAAGLIARTLPDKPTSRLQKYRITPQGRARLTR